MFTDGPVTPLHVETLIEVLRRLGGRKMTREALYGALQPSGLTGSQQQSKDAIRASIELELINEREDSELELTEAAKGRRSVRECVLEAIDNRVLRNAETEYYFALFYSYMLGLGKDAKKRKRDEWVTAFNRDVFDNKKQINQFNAEKWTGLHRWFVYAGLGWDDPGGEFLCSPYHRVQRNLPEIFGGKQKLDDKSFMDRIGAVCPELDEGEMFQQANRKSPAGARRCTLGLSHVLINLHLDNFIRLHCSRDSSGWSLQEASPPNDGKTLLSDRIDFVEIRKGAR
jgi:hypothetical protein